MWLADLFEDLGYLFYKLYYYAASAAVWIEDNLGWSGLATIFYNMADFFGDQWLLCYDIAGEIEDLWSWLTDKVSKFDNLYYYVHGWIVDKINEAINAASTALSTANQAINDAAAAFQKAISEAAAALTAAKEYAETLVPNIATWVQEHALDVYTAIQGYLTDIAAWVTANSFDLWQAVRDHLAAAIDVPLASIAAPINLVNLWFNSIQDFFNDPWGWLEVQFESWFEKNW